MKQGKTKPLHLKATMTVGAAFALIMGNCADHLAVSAKCASQSPNPQTVHQLRVAIRRLRAAVSDFRRTAQYKHRPVVLTKLRALQQQLGGAREWDVLIDETIGSTPRRLRGRGLRQVVEAAELQRTQGYDRARAALEDRGYTDLLPRVLLWKKRNLKLNTHHPANGIQSGALYRPVGEFAAELVRERRKKAKKLGKKIRKLDLKQLHRLRIRVKKLRYTVEFFGDVLPGLRTERYLSALKKLQQVLGTAHDTIVAVDLVTTLEKSEGKSVEPAASMIRNWALECHKRDRKKLVALWRRLETHDFN
jgi:triphosphatase